MATISVFGGTGYAGEHIVRAALDQGHDVTVVSRNSPERPVEGARYVTGNILDAAVRERAINGSDVVVLTVAPRGDMAGEVRPAYARFAQEAAGRVRLGVVGGAGSLRTSDDGPRLVDTGAIPDAFLAEVLEFADVLEDLRAASERLDWFYVSPAAEFGAHNPGEARGRYRTGGDVLLADSEGHSRISGPDLGLAVADEITTPRHRRERFTVAY